MRLWWAELRREADEREAASAIEKRAQVAREFDEEQAANRARLAVYNDRSRGGLARVGLLEDGYSHSYAAGGADCEVGGWVDCMGVPRGNFEELVFE